MSRSLVWRTLVLLLTTPVLCVAQDPKISTTLKSKAELVLVPVVVTRDGTTVNGLRAQDFLIFGDGKPKRVDSFEVVTSPDAVSTEAAPVQPATAQNFNGNLARNQDVGVLVLDFLNASWSSSARTRSYLRDIVGQFQANKTPFAVCLLTTRGLFQIHSLGNTAEDLIQAISTWEKRSPGAANFTSLAPSWVQTYVPVEQKQAVDKLASLTRSPGFEHMGKDYVSAAKLDQAAMTLTAFEQIAEAYQGVGGRKKMVWITIGLPSGGIGSKTGLSDSILDFEVADRASRTLKLLNDANIAVYPIDANGAVNPTWEEHFSPALDSRTVLSIPSITEERPTNNFSLLEFAARTGGKLCTAHPDTCVGLAVNDARHYYVLGFYLRGDVAKGWHKLEVKVKREHVSVRSRTGFMVGHISGSESVQKEMVLAALASAVDYTGVPLRLQWKRIEHEAASTMELEITSPPGGISINSSDPKLDVDLLVYVRTAGNDQGQSFPVSLKRALSRQELGRLATQGFLFRKEIPVAPGEYELRVFVRDNTSNRIGTVSTTVRN